MLKRNNHLHILFQGHLETVKELLKLPGIDVNAANSDGRTPLHWAAEYGLKNKSEFFTHAFLLGHASILAVLIAVPGVNLAVQNNEGDTPLHLAADKGKCCRQYHRCQR